MNTFKIGLLIFILNNFYSYSQSMESLYEYVLDDAYNYMNEHSTFKDTIFYSFGLNDCLDEFYSAYDLNMENNRILNKIPDVDAHNPNSFLYVLFAPQLEKNAVVIPLGFYSIKFVLDGDTNLIFNGTTKYFFIYDKRKKCYKF